MRKDSIMEFAKASRDDLVEQYQKEIDILTEYMPEQLSMEDVLKIVDEVFSKINPTTQKQMGMVMKEVTPLVKGKFDMGEISKIVRDKFNNL